jgi:sugar-specific transcriptional regulator TrmB
MELGLMSSYKEGKKFHFFAEKPSKIVNILIKRQQHELESRERELERAVPELKALQARRHSTPVVKYYAGKDGVKKLARKRLEDMGGSSKDKVSRHIYSEEVVSSIFSRNELEKINHNILKADSPNKALVVRDHDAHKVRREQDVYITSNELSMNCDISIHEDEVHIISFADPVSGISIKDPHISETMVTIFDSLLTMVRGSSSQKEGNGDSKES